MLLDTSALIEYFRKSESGIRAAKIIETGTGYISILTLAEVKNWCIKERLNASLIISKVKNSLQILNISEDVAEYAGEIRQEQRLNDPNFGLVDAIIYATARLYGLKVLTKDSQFEGLADVEFI
jgi:predicted nucleic acid-binding protein